MSDTSTQLRILQAELEAVQKQIDKYDQFSMTTRTWAVTLWVASLGWAFQGHRSAILILSIAPLVIFWILDTINKAFRYDYKERRNAIGIILERLFRGQPIPEDTCAPQFPKHQVRKIVKSFSAAHMAFLYVALITISLVLYFVFPV